MHASGVQGRVQLPDGHLASVGEDRGLCVTDLATGAGERHLVERAPTGLRATGDGQRLLITHYGFHGDAMVGLWDVRTKQTVGEFPVGGLDVAAPDRQHLFRLAERALVVSHPQSAPSPASAPGLARALVNQDTATAAELGRELFDRGMAEMDGELLDGLAWHIASALPGLHRDLDLALRAAQEAVRLTDGKYWSALDTLAQVHFARGEIDLAIATQKRAIALVDHESLRESLSGYEAAAVSKRK